MSRAGLDCGEAVRGDASVPHFATEGLCPGLADQAAVFRSAVVLGVKYDLVCTNLVGSRCPDDDSELRMHNHAFRCDWQVIC